MQAENMMILLLAGLFLFHSVSAYDIFESIGRLDCIPVKDYEECSTSLVEAFDSTYETAGLNEPDTWVYFFDPRSPEVAIPLHKCGGKLPDGYTLDTNATIVIIVHGGNDGLCRTAWMREMKVQFMQHGCYYVILVDWTWGNPPNFAVSAKNWRVTGDQIGFVIRNIMDATGIGPDRFYVVGHSFGTQVATFISRSVPGLGRITGLDPAVTPQEYQSDYLTYENAELVDIIHSNGGNCVGIYFGDERQLGHADFYPNGGVIQTSCYLDSLKAFLKMDYIYALGVLYPPLCSHLQVLQYYKSSINSGNCVFVGFNTSSYAEFLLKKPNFQDNEWAIMGLRFKDYPRKDKQKFYLKTTETCPYVDTSYLKGVSLPFEVSCP